MAEAIVLVCDACGRPAKETITFRHNKINRQKDFCQRHLNDLLDNSRAPRRGRKRTTAR